MKNKLIILIGMFMFFNISFSKINMKLWNENREKLINSNMTVEEAYENLVNASSIGYDYNDVYLNVILKEKNSEELLEKLFYDSKTNVGKIISLQGMYVINNKKYKKMKEEIHGEVSLNHGCYSTKKTVIEYLENMELNFENNKKESA